MIGASSFGWEPPRTRPLTGSPASWTKPVAGTRLHVTLSVIAIAFTAKYSSAVSARWAFEIDRRHHDRRGRMHMRNGVIGSIRRECVDHVVVLGERHLWHLLLSYMKYYNETRTHLSLNKDAPLSRAVQTVGRIICLPILGGLHHHYVRI
jgi:hypothetical protein